MKHTHLEGEVLQLGFDAPHSQPIGQRRKDVQRILRGLLGGRRAHEVQVVRQHNEHGRHVLHGQQHGQEFLVQRLGDASLGLHQLPVDLQYKHKDFQLAIAGLQEARMMSREPASTMSNMGDGFKASISLHASVQWDTRLRLH